MAIKIRVMFHSEDVKTWTFQKIDNLDKVFIKATSRLVEKATEFYQPGEEVEILLDKL